MNGDKALLPGLMDFESASCSLSVSPTLPGTQSPSTRSPRTGQHLSAALTSDPSINARYEAGQGGGAPQSPSFSDGITAHAFSSSSSSSSPGFEKRGVTIKLIRAVRDYIKLGNMSPMLTPTRFRCIVQGGVVYRRSMDFNDRVVDNSGVQFRAVFDAEEVDEGAWLKCEVPSQGTLFLPMKTIDGRIRITHASRESIWSIGRVCALVVGNHEILKTSCRLGDNIDPNSTLTYSGRCSLIDLLREKHPNVGCKHPQLGVSYEEVVGSKANVFISFAYGDNFFEFVESLELFMGKHPELIEEYTYFWLDLFVNDQWNALARPFDWWATTFREAVEEIGNTLCFLSPWSDPSIFKRAWCLLEISYSKNLSLLLSKKQLLKFHHTMRFDIESITASLCKIDMRNASAFLEEDKEKIFAVVEQMEEGFHGFNVKVMSLIREWVASSARSMLDGINLGAGVVGEGDDDEEEEDSSSLSKDSLDDMHRTAILLSEHGNYEEAKALFQRALEGQERTLGREHPSTLGTVGSLANLFRQQGDFEGAKALYQRVLEGEEKALGREHPSTLHTVHNLGALLYRQGDFERAKVLYQRALEGKENALGFEHPETLSTVGNLGTLLHQTGDLEEAKALYQRALEGREKVLGREHPDTLSTVGNLANLLSDQGNFEGAKAMYQQALKGEEKVLGREHPDTLSTVANLGTLLQQQSDLAGAKALYKRALEGREKVLGREHPDTLSTVANLGTLLQQQGDLAGAKALYQRALVGFEKVCGCDHPSTINAASLLTSLLDSKVDIEGTNALHQRSLEG